MRILVTASLLLCLFIVVQPAAAEEKPSPQKVFNERIMPIFRSDNPSSCVQCHLSGVDLKNYILPSSEQTFVSLRDQGLIDLDKPRESKILKLITMQPEGSGAEKKGAALIHEKNRKAEYEAFAAWIEAASADPKLRSAPPLEKSKVAGPDRPDEVIRHNRADGVLESFTRNVWALRFRCVHCHMPGALKFEKHVDKHGEKMGWLLKDGPAATMDYLIEKKLIDLNKPEESLLLLKPLNEVEHGGGQKMARGDADYMAFLGWIQDYARITKNEYKQSDDLPNRATYTGSEIWLRIENLPESWVERTGLLTVHAPSDRPGGWSEKPVAITTFTVRKGPKLGIFAHGFLMVRSKVADEPTLRPGRYLVKLHLEKEKRATTDFEDALKAATFEQSFEVRSDWKAGFKDSTVIRR